MYYYKQFFERSCSMLESSRIRLRPVEEKDYPLLHKWRNESKFLALVSPKRELVNFDKFALEMKRAFERDRHLQFMIELKETGLAVGTIYSFGLNLTDGYVFINVYVDEKYERFGYGAQAGILLLCYLFDFFPIFKVYFDVFGYNSHSLSTLTSAGFKEEGRFVGHRFYEGQRFDVIRFAAFRDSIQRIRKIEERISKRRTYKTPQ